MIDPSVFTTALISFQTGRGSWDRARKSRRCASGVLILVTQLPFRCLRGRAWDDHSVCLRTLGRRVHEVDLQRTVLQERRAGDDNVAVAGNLAAG
jgi:hypothetical protein